MGEGPPPASWDRLLSRAPRPPRPPHPARSAQIPKHHFSSVEGRTAHPILGTPGGDLGEWLIALTTYQDIAGRKVHLGEYLRATRTGTARRRCAYALLSWRSSASAT